MDTDREIYPGAPLRFVAFELRYPLVPTLATDEVRRTLYARLRESFPIAEAAPGEVAVQIGPGQPVVNRSDDRLRLLDRARTRSVTLSNTSLVLETSAYERFEVFRQWIDAAAHALAELGEVAAIERVGLRYTDEIRIPGVSTPAEWAPYIHGSLLGPVDLGDDLRANTTQGLVEYVVSEQQRIVMRYGATSGWVVNPEGPLRVSPPEPEDYFLIDLDSFWTAGRGELPEVSAERVLNLSDDLHEPVRRLFEASITDKLRNDVLRKKAA
jgi:uncharacterized protein (TIGR04255 family)